MANTQKVSCKAMKEDAESLSFVLKNIPQTIDKLQVSMRSLSQCWEGPAWAAFQMQVNEDIQNMQEIYQYLVEFQKKLGEGRNTYLRMEYEIYRDLKALWI